MEQQSIYPPCRHCGGATTPNCQLKSGLTQYRCKSCRKYTTPGVKRGRPKGDTPGLSSGDRVRKSRAKLTPEQKAERTERNRLRRMAKRRAMRIVPERKAEDEGN